MEYGILTKSQNVTILGRGELGEYFSFCYHSHNNWFSYNLFL